jgi:hypothetical protein
MADLVAVERYLTPAEAEIAKFQLAQHGIPSRVEGAELVTWLWYLSDAFRGASLVVVTAEAARSAEILSDKHVDAAAHSSRTCSGCGEMDAVDWLVCWRCGTSTDGISDESIFREECRPSPLLAHLANVEFLGLWLCLAAALLIVIPPLALVYSIMLLVFACPTSTSTELSEFTPEDNADAISPVSSSDLNDEVSRRALASAMFGVTWFAPFSLYSILLLLSNIGAPKSVKGQLWQRVALGINGVALSTFAIVFALVSDLFDWRTNIQPFQFWNNFIENSIGSIVSFW